MPKHDRSDAQPGRNKPYSRPNQSRPRLAHYDHASSSQSRRPYNPSNQHSDAIVKPPRPQKVVKPPKQQSQSLDLSNSPLTAPPSLGDYPQLSKLNLTNTTVDSIAFVATVASTLTWLNVSGNDLSQDGAWTGIDQLKTLFVLNASHCSLTAVPSCVASLSSLKALVLSHNSLTRLEHLVNLPDLNTIVVSNNQLGALPSSLSTLPSLKKISAAHNKLTSSTLPDLSSLSHLSELRLNDNPSLTSLPPHFGIWGKAPLLPSDSNTASASTSARAGLVEDRRRSKGRQGLEILDLGNCGFKSWFGLKELARQDGVVNLGLKGNKAAEEAIKESGVEEFKHKLTVLLPSLRILDNNRFDPKFAGLKARRASRTSEQAILESGPMGLALNKARENSVEISKDSIRLLEIERENRKRRKRGLEEVDLEVERKRREEKRLAKEERRKKWEEEELAKKEQEEEARKGKKREVEEGGETERKKQNGKDKRAERATVIEGGDAQASGTAASVPSTTNSADADAPTQRKRARRSKADKSALASFVGDSSTSTSTSKPAKSTKTKQPKAIGGSLAATPGELPSPNPRTAPASTPAKPPSAEPEPEKPVKTSVAKIIEVRRTDGAQRSGNGKDKGKGKKGKNDELDAEKERQKRELDLGALLGLGQGQGEKQAGQVVEEEQKEQGGSGLAALGGGWGGAIGGGWD
ncbi:hypothetical protein JCM11641_001854 [Rhodosporidiobolus odoratus]